MPITISNVSATIKHQFSVTGRTLGHHIVAVEGVATTDTGTTTLTDSDTIEHANYTLAFGALSKVESFDFANGDGVGEISFNFAVNAQTYSLSGTSSAAAEYYIQHARRPGATLSGVSAVVGTLAIAGPVQSASPSVNVAVSPPKLGEALTLTRDGSGNITGVLMTSLCGMKATGNSTVYQGTLDGEAIVVRYLESALAVAVG